MYHITRRGLLGVSIASMALAHPGISHAQSKQTLTIGYSDFGALYEELGQQCERRHPGIGVRLLASASTYDELLQRAIRDALVGQPQDLLFQGFGQIPILVERKIAQPLDIVIEKDPAWTASGIAETGLQLGRYNSKIFGLPFALATSLIYYYRDLLLRAGFKSELPTAWEEIIRLANRVNLLGEAYSGGRFYYVGNWLFPALINSRGGHLMAPDGSIGFNDENGRYALWLLQEFGRAGMKDMSSGQARHAFINGTMGILVGSSSWIAAWRRRSESPSV
ncbi:extracellular solute-binding protein [Bradyrhizobium sp. SRL28]|uniref:ABC transporter substrate-binding protein n=1 Tax=Bradyrhizobium sp. SRL28 TaxID=2836178 RepID=UPI001BDEBE6A|nr:extracellular solute-binding protein [Bradyrhizobium sp. SRL28]MBT1517257.1 extracellular solute-binding protein [Bradyrhizobium sp. SRL28]